jgi:hypothetical protein
VGEAGPVEQSSVEAKSLKTMAKELSNCYSSEQQPRKPDRGPVGQIKGYSYDMFTKEKKSKQLLAEAQKEQKAARQRKPLSSRIVVAEVEDEVSVDMGE